MTNQHPVNIIANTITKWRTYYRKTYKGNLSEIDYIAANAAQWGADQELEACCEWLENQTLCGHRELIPSLRRLRRPKPPTLKEQALGIIDDNIEDGPSHISFALEEIKTIRRALEALDDADL